MGFLKKILPNENNQNVIDVNTTPEEAESANLETVTNKFNHHSNLMSKLFRTQKFFSAPPEVLHENEAWAPEYEYVGLFRKHRASAEEQTSSSSGPQ